MGEVEKRKVGMLQCTKMLASIDEVSISVCVCVCLRGGEGQRDNECEFVHLQDCINLFATRMFVNICVCVF